MVTQILRRPQVLPYDFKRKASDLDFCLPISEHHITCRLDMNMTEGYCEPNLAWTGAAWLASSPPSYPYRIGVRATTREEAERRFGEAVAAWRELHQRPGPRG